MTARKGRDTYGKTPQQNQRASKKHSRQFLWSVCYFMTQYLVVYNLPSINHQTKQIKCTFVSYSPPFLQRSWMLQRNLFNLNDYVQCQLETKNRSEATLLQEGVKPRLTQEKKVACSAHRLLHIYMYVLSSFVVKLLGDSKYVTELHTLYFSCDLFEVIGR